VTFVPSDTPTRSKSWKRGDETLQWIDQDRDAVTQRYDRLAGLIPLFDWLLFQPRGFRRKAVAGLNLKPGDHVLEIGCGTGRNFSYLREAVGPHGRVYGVDISAGMLGKARALCERCHWNNVELIQLDAVNYEPPQPLDGVMFGLSYNTMPHHLAVLRHAWNLLRPGGRLVIMDAKLPPGLGGKLFLPFGLWLMKRTLLGNPLIRPWEDLARLTEDFDMQELMFGSYYICRGIKR
jgi:demethylmenaquinone methyltransferase/2-methoxy-6-polyprenyl-1,4-benzoquinol methylase